MLTLEALKTELDAVLADIIKTENKRQVYFNGKVFDIQLAPDPAYLSKLKPHKKCSEIEGIENIYQFKVTCPDR